MKHKRSILQKVVLTIIFLALVACSTPQSKTPQIPPTVTKTITSVDGTWTKRTNMPTERWEHNTCVVDGKIYVIGGAGPVYDALRTVEEYDPATDTWTAKSEMFTARQGLSASVVNGKIYAIGGGVSSSSSYSNIDTFSIVEEYDPETDIWTTKSPMPTARGWHSANVVDGKIYILGGSQDATPVGGHVLTVEVYDPVTDIWSQKSDMPEARAAGSGSVVDGKIYLFGGYGGKQRVNEYDPLTDTWTQKADMLTRRVGSSTSVLDGKIYITGGFALGYTGVTIVEVYDLTTDTWATATDMPTGRFGAYTSVVDGKMYVIGGMPNWPGKAYGIVEVYEPEKE